jgi:glycosyltransferase involved in cell wall biosynthesis
VPIRWQGHVAGDEALATLYCAVDVSAVPIREDNMPLAAMEAQTCGRPVVAFRIGGLPDIVEHLATGYLAQPFDSDDLAKGLIQALDDSRHDGTWSSAARRHALDHWSTPGIIASYLDVYREALA